MTALPLSGEPVAFPLRPGRGTLALHATGFRSPRAWRGAERFTAYADVTHLVHGGRALRIGTRRGVFGLRRNLFQSPDGLEAFTRALLQRIASEPTGPVQIARMAEIEETARRPVSPLVARVLAVACIAAFALQAWLGPGIHHAGFFSAPLATNGEPWRLMTANLLHAGPGHLVLNLLGLLVLGGLVERTLGSARTVLVAGLGALGATFAGLVANYEVLVGASGIVAAFAGALLYIELRLPERIPAQWRIPRGPFIAALLADAALPLALPEIAGAAHVGGFLAGVLAAGLVATPSLAREPLRPAASLAVALVIALAGASLASAARLVAGGAAWEAHAERLLALPDSAAMILNDAAWLIATDRAPTRKALEGARELAERAVEETGHQEPNFLDTLAEVEFQRGEGAAAVETIDEAIALAPGVSYFREQRRRFTGERARDDRPAPPAEGDFPPAVERPDPIPAHKGLRDEDPGVEI